MSSSQFSSNDNIIIESRERSGYPLTPSNSFDINIKGIVREKDLNGQTVHLNSWRGVNFLYNVEDKGKPNNLLSLKFNGTLQTLVTIAPGNYSLATLSTAINAVLGTVTLTQSSLTGMVSINDSGSRTITFGSRGNNTLLEMLGFIDLNQSGASGVITATTPPNFIKHSAIYLRFSGASGFIKATSNDRSNIIATIPIGLVCNWNEAFVYEPTHTLPAVLGNGSQRVEVVDAWGNLVQNLGEWTCGLEIGEGTF